jgi:hypothetical protein
MGIGFGMDGHPAEVRPVGIYDVDISVGFPGLEAVFLDDKGDLPAVRGILRVFDAFDVIKVVNGERLLLRQGGKRKKRCREGESE